MRLDLKRSVEENLVRENGRELEDAGRAVDPHAGLIPVKKRGREDEEEKP